MAENLEHFIEKFKELLAGLEGENRTLWIILNMVILVGVIIYAYHERIIEIFAPKREAQQ